MNELALTIAFGRALRQQRKLARLTQEQLGLTAGLQRNYVSELERGLKQASVVTLFKLAEAMQLLPEDFTRHITRELGMNGPVSHP